MKFNLKRVFFLTLSYFISYLIPRDSNRVVIGSRDGKRFADNSRYFFYFLNKQNIYNVIWLTKSKKVEAYLKKKKSRYLIQIALEVYIMDFELNIIYLIIRSMTQVSSPQ
jgi:CDP-glycerol glycerophosphotransferase (TagB/SpsB family)